MEAKNLFENATFLQIIEDLKINGVKFDKYQLADSEEFMNKHLGYFREASRLINLSL